MAQFPLIMERPERLRKAARGEKNDMLKLEAHGKLVEWVYKHLVYFLTTNYSDFGKFAACASAVSGHSVTGESNDIMKCCKNKIIAFSSSGVCSLDPHLQSDAMAYQ